MPRKILFTLLLSVFALTLQAQIAQFSADKTSGCFPLTVQFTDESIGAVGWSWSFGNGNTSGVQHPGAVYTSPGVYTVTLTINGGADTEVKTGYIVVHDFPQGDFSFDKNEGCAPLQVQFTSQVSNATGNITDWLWVFGDGGTSDEANPSYTFLQSGDRAVSLKITNQYGCESTIVKNSAIHVKGPMAAFTPSVTEACQAPLLVNFTNQSSGVAPLTYQWDFGDGAGSAATSPSHLFTTFGNFPVKLNVTDGEGCTAQRVIPIAVGAGGGLDFSPSATRVCRGSSVSFYITSDAPIMNLTWNFGNGTASASSNATATYNQAGTFTVTLTAQLQGHTCVSVVSKTITVIPNAVPAFTNTVNCNSVVTFSSTSTSTTWVQWLVNGSSFSEQNTFSTPLPPGDYIIRLTAFNELDCPSVLERTLHVPVAPSAAFTPFEEQSCTELSLSGCAPFQIQFHNTSISELAFTSQWLIGSTTSTLKDPPSHTFTTSGNFPVRLIISDSRGCKDTASSIVKVSATTPTAAFTQSKLNVCVKEEILFANQAQNADFLCWDFGDGTVVSGFSPTHTYEHPGTYTVTLTAKNAGCSNQLKKTGLITVRDPYVDFKVTKSCADPFTIQLDNLSENAESFAWDLGDGTVSTSATGFIHTFAATGSYLIRLTGTSATQNCVVPNERNVIIQQVKADFTLDTDRPCKDVVVHAKDASDFATYWTWSLDGVPFSSKPDTTFQSSVPGNHVLQLTVGDSDGCSSTKDVDIIVPDITGNFTYVAESDCNKFDVQFTDASTASPPIQDWTWNFGDGSATSTGQNASHAYDVLGAYTVTLTLANGVGECDFVKTEEIVFQRPIPEFTVSDPNLCIGEVLTIANYTIAASTYYWELGNGITSTAATPQYSYDKIGSYDITVHATDAYGCEVSLTKPHVATVYQPEAAFQAFQTSAACPPLTTIFDDQSNGSGLQWSWDFGNGVTSVLENPANVYEKAGSYDVSLRVTDQYGCFDVETKEDFVSVGGPSGDFTLSVPEACEQGFVTFDAHSVNATMHRWDFGDGIVQDVSMNTTTHAYGKRGAYHPSLILVDDKGCQVVADGPDNIEVHGNPSIDFSFEPCLFEGEMLRLQTAEQDLNFTWSIDGLAVGEGAVKEILMESTGQYEVKLTAVNEFDCRADVAAMVFVHGKIGDIPNVFTANGDEFNQTMEIKGIENSQWSLRVFNRWGKEVYENENYQNNWDGAGIGAGVYFYLLTNSYCPDRSYKGYITVVK